MPDQIISPMKSYITHSLDSLWYGVKVGPGPHDPGRRDVGTPGPPSKFQSGTPQDPLQRLKVGPS